MADERRRSAYEFSTDQQAHLGVVILTAMLFLIYQATHEVANISRVEMARLGTVSMSTQLPGTEPEAGTGAEGGDELTVDGRSLLPPSAATSAASLGEFVGQSAIGRGVIVLGVTADEGFWVGASTADRVWIQLTGAGESPYTVRPGDRAYFLGTVVSHSASYARTACAGDAQGVELLIAQAAHIEVPQDHLSLNR